MNKKVRVLHVEDNRADAELVKRAARKEVDFEWHLATTKSEYLAELESFDPHVIVCDHSMPGFNSEEALEIMKQRRSHIPFILVTGTVSEEFAVMMMKSGVDDYLLKDRIQRLPTAIAQALAKRHAEKEKDHHLEQAIKNEANLAAIIENSDAHVYSLDEEFRYITFNSNLRNVLRQTYGLNIRQGDVVFDFLNKLEPAEAKEWEQRYRKALTGKSLKFIKEYHVGGIHTFTSFSINPIREGDKVTGLSCVVWDVTEQKLAHEKIKKSEARFRALLENNYDAIIVRDENLKIIYRSASANKMIGYPPDEKITSQIYDDIHPDDGERFRSLLPLVMANPGKSYPMNLRAKHKDGHFIWLEGSVRNMLHNENVKGIIFNYRDISERMELERQREKMIKDITQRVNDLEQFTYIVSHNLRAPVANILGLSQILQLSPLNESDKHEAMAGIHHSAGKLDEVILDLNNVLLKKQGHSEPTQNVQFQSLVDDIQGSISDLIETNHASVITDFTAVNGLPTIKSYLYSIFYNLVINAIKYRRALVPPVITITGYFENGKTILSFKDNGRGIDLASNAKDLFGLYRRFHHDIEGKGMGLFMVKMQVESLGGTIHVKSEVDSGSEFIIKL